MMHGHYAFGVVVISALATLAASHPLCYYSEKPTDLDIVMEFCPNQVDGACCNEAEEDAAEFLFNTVSSSPLTGECGELYKQVACGPCNAYSGHLYERLGEELGAADGMTMKSSFCEDLVTACVGFIDFPTYDGLSYCEKHVGDNGDLLWSYPIDESELVFTATGLVDAFPDLPESDLPSELLCMHMTIDGSEWWLGGQQGEIVKIPVDNPVSSSTVLDLSSGMELLYEFEEGLMDFAFHPGFYSNSFFYVSYTIEDSEGSKNRLSRFTYDSSSSTATKNSVQIILTSEVKPTFRHSGGWVGFKPSDYDNPDASSYEIYWGVGDGGPQTDPENNAQRLDNLHGAMMRVVVPSSAGSPEEPYVIPGGNLEGGREEICAIGFRNPFRCGFDSMTDDLFCGDIGQARIEQINLVECGKNYGWGRFEGSRCQEAAEDRFGDCDGADRGGYTFPEYEYCHPDYQSDDSGEQEFTAGIDICGSRAVTGNAVISGYVYRGERFSDVLSGALLFGDYQNGNIYFLVKDGEVWNAGTIISDGTAPIISFAEDNNREQYLISADRKPYKLPCGDLCGGTCLSQSDVTPSYTSMGCFADDPGNRALKLKKAPGCDEGEDVMSPAVCASYCDTISSAVFFGVEFAYECFCGSSGEDYDKNGALDEEFCSTVCTGTPQETCGGFNAIEIYSFESGTLPPLPEDPFEDPSSSSSFHTDDSDYIGCFGDSRFNRVLSGANVASDEMTLQATNASWSGNGSVIQVCAEYCLGSSYFGTEYSTQCFCSSASDVYDEFGEATCDMNCAGDSSETCGGFNAISIYAHKDSVTPSPVSSGGYSYVGCYLDNQNNRVLNTALVSDDSMTTEFCSGECAGSTHFGTEYGVQCFCGSPSSFGTEAENCDMPCGGLSSETCGGRFAISVYEYSAGFTYIGCYADDKSDRVMGGKTSSNAMTAEACAIQCAGYPYFGTQFGSECWCGSTDVQGTVDTSTECTMACTGDSSEICGGFDALSVYQH